MKKFASLLIAASALLGFAGAAHAEAEKDAKPVNFSFEGPFGKFDQAELQRGYKVYKEVCSNCHSMKYIAFRNLADKGGPSFTEEQVKALAKTFKFGDFNDQGEAIQRDGLPSDHFPSPFPNEGVARAANGGALPPDLSLITKAREGWHGTFNQLINGIGGPQYVYSVLTGFEDPPEDVAKEQPPGKYYNPYFANGIWISMPPNGTLTDGLVTFDDGAPNKVEDMAKDVAAFLAWTAEPKMEERKQLGFQVLIYLIVFAGLLYAVKKKIWSKVH